MAIAAAGAGGNVDVLIVARGGGSIEDLWAFNEEIVARAVFESAIPVVSGVGHETDFTICDFVADVRAPTPTGAAMLVVPDRRAVLADVGAIGARWRRTARHAMEARQQRVDGLARRLVHPAARLAQQRRDAAALAVRLDRAYRSRIAAATHAVREQGGRLTWLLRRPLPHVARLAPLRDAMLRAASLTLERRPGDEPPRSSRTSRISTRKRCSSAATPSSPTPTGRSSRMPGPCKSARTSR